MIENDEKHNSQFLYGCNTDWNLNVEFLYWINYWFKEYKKNASKVVDLTFRKYKYKGKELNQKEVIDRVIELTGNLIEERDGDLPPKKAVEEVFKLFEMVYYSMWW